MGGLERQVWLAATARDCRVFGRANEEGLEA